VPSRHYWACFWNSTSLSFLCYTHIWTIYKLLITQKLLNKNFSGGSLGSYVDEGRSKMRELVWIAGHIEHRYSERKLQSEACLHSTPVWGSLLNPSNYLLGWACDWQQSLALVWTLRGSTGSLSVSLDFYRIVACTLYLDQLIFWPQIRREHSLNLSILLSEGKETNKDSPSNGEWRGTSTMSNPCVSGALWNVT
jgi:hypothetical protein